MHRHLFTTVALALAAAWPAAAQDSALTETPTRSTVPVAAPGDVASIEAIITALYDVISGPKGEARDWDRFRSLFVPEGYLIPTSFPEGSPRARAQMLGVEDYITRAGPFLEEHGFFEVEVGHVAERFENIAHVFSTYESRNTADQTEPFQRGINSVQLMWDGERWWVVNVMWRGVGPEHRIPEKYLNR